MVKTCIPFQLGERDEDAGTDSASVQLPMGKQIVQASLTNRKVLSGIPSINKQPLLRGHGHSLNRLPPH